MCRQTTPIAKCTSNTSQIIKKICEKERITMSFLACQTALICMTEYRGVHNFDSMLKIFKNQIKFTSIIPLNFAYIFFHYLLLALSWLLFVAVNDQGQKKKK